MPTFDRLAELPIRVESYELGSADALTFPYAVEIAAGSLATWAAFSSELLAR